MNTHSTQKKITLKLENRKINSWWWLFLIACPGHTIGCIILNDSFWLLICSFLHSFFFHLFYIIFVFLHTHIHTDQHNSQGNNMTAVGTGMEPMQSRPQHLICMLVGSTLETMFKALFSFAFSFCCCCLGSCTALYCSTQNSNAERFCWLDKPSWDGPIFEEGGLWLSGFGSRVPKKHSPYFHTCEGKGVKGEKRTNKKVEGPNSSHNRHAESKECTPILSSSKARLAFQHPGREIIATKTSLPHFSKCNWICRPVSSSHGTNFHMEYDLWWATYFHPITSFILNLYFHL